MVEWLWGFESTRAARAPNGRSALDEARAMQAVSTDEEYAEIVRFLTRAATE